MAEAQPTEDAFARSAGRQLLLLGLAAVAFLIVLMLALQALASMVGSSNTSAQALDPATNTITIALREEPPQLNTTITTDAVSGIVLGHTMEGLLRMSMDDRLEPAIAHSWEVKPTHATFWLRDNARWSDGSPITAADFVFAWKTALDPANASQYAFLLFHIRNGEAINKGELPTSELGVRTPDPHTLIVELERPIAFFDKMVTFPTYLPVQEKFYLQTDGRFGADAEELLYSGPFNITSWVHGASLMLEKNPNYWDHERIRLDRINFGYITSDATATLNFFKDDKIAYTTLEAENLDNALENRWQIKREQDGTVFYIEFNHRDTRVTRNWNLRRAMQLSLDMDELVYKVTKKPGYIPGRSLFPGWLMGVNDYLRKEYPAPEQVIDFEAAQQHLELAKQELGVTEIPEIVLLTGDNPVSNIQSEWVQATLKKRLGLDIKIDKQIFKQRLAKMTTGEFDMVLAGWGPDYDDPLTFGDLFASWNLNNRGQYDSPEMDSYIRQAQNSVVPEERMAAFGAIQQLIYDDIVILPQYERGVTYVVHPELAGVKRRVIGSEVDFTNAYIVGGGD